MKLVRSQHFLRMYRRLPGEIRKKVDRQLQRLVKDIRHPGLYAKKMSGVEDIWEARIDYHNRLTFQIEGDIIFLRRVGPHDILKKP